jgi:hypothetical protein
VPPKPAPTPLPTPPAPPKPAAPETAVTTEKFVGTGDDVLLTWVLPPEVEHDAVQVIIYRAADPTTIILKSELLTGNTYLVPNPLTLGTADFFYRVVAVRFDAKGAVVAETQMAEAAFQVPPLGAPKISPAGVFYGTVKE